ncbi:MAG: T9SS type A sorting domain-containing protein [Bacteroidetes bacterium]|nr:T9SS type A sorting domain-containing protein [Bacteroidota bacterium]
MRSFYLLLLFVFSACMHRSPVPYDENEGENGKMELHTRFLDLQHRAAPGFNWKSANDAIMVQAYQNLASKSVQQGVLANGKIKGGWFERGSINQAGSVISVDYVPAGNRIYAISAGGTLWRGSLTGNDWVELNRDLRFQSGILQVFQKPGGGLRILTAIGKKIWYSDDEGATFKEASGWNYYDGWGGPVQLVAAQDANNTYLYYSVLTWDATPWAPRVQLYYSADMGQTFSLATVFSHGNTDQVSMWNPYGTTACFLLNQSSKLYSLNGTTLTTVSNTNLLPAGVSCQLRGYRSPAGAYTLYALCDHKKVYRSTNNGNSWVLRGTTPSNAWSVGMEVSLSDPNKIFYGEVNCFRSADGGSSWNTVNEWWEYYGDVSGKLHADIMEIEFFRKSDNTEFALINNHGGMSVSYDFLQTNQNIGMNHLNVSQYYDVRTDPTDPNFMYAGSQDQGYQRATTAGVLPFGVLPFTQIVSGDYGQMVFSSNGRHLWKQYPGGDITYHQEPKTSDSWWDSEWQVSGSDLPNVGWMLPTAEHPFQAAANSIYLGGGNLQGGSGSHLITLTASEQDPYTITATQDAFDFKPNSNNGSALISAIAESAINGRLYVATDDGTFFRKNLGGNWQKASGFDGPEGFYLYGSCILPSRLNPDLVWFSGSGYSNAPVWQSTDGGLTFSALSNGLPGTLVQELAASPDEKFLFAATDNGPYVFVTEDKTWYSLKDESMPLQTVYSVEYVAAQHLVRFGTHGRGIWDFVFNDIRLDATVYPSNCGPASGEIQVVAHGGSSPYQYLWPDGRITDTYNGLSGGVYEVTVVDANGLTASTSISVNEGGKPEKPANITWSVLPCGPVLLSWEGPSAGTYQLRYRQGNQLSWTALGNIGTQKQYALDVDAANGSHLELALKYVCPGNTQSGWASVSLDLPDCFNSAPTLQANTRPGASMDLLVFPNPAHTFTTLTWNVPLGQTTPLRLFDGSGRMVRYEILHAGSVAFQLSLDGLQPGVYFVSFGNQFLKKLVISV